MTNLATLWFGNLHSFWLALVVFWASGEWNEQNQAKKQQFCEAKLAVGRWAKMATKRLIGICPCERHYFWRWYKENCRKSFMVWYSWTTCSDTEHSCWLAWKMQNDDAMMKTSTACSIQLRWNDCSKGRACRLSDKTGIENQQYCQKHTIKYSKTTKNKPGGVAAVLHRAFYYILTFKMRDAVACAA